MQANDVEFSTASGDSSERMQARRKRMEVRHAAKTEGTSCVVRRGDCVSMLWTWLRCALGTWGSEQDTPVHRLHAARGC